MATINEIIESLKGTPADQLYKVNNLISNNKVDTGERYCDIIADYLLHHTEYFDNIKRITRKNSYRTTSHAPLSEAERDALDEKKRQEEWVARSLLFKTIDAHDFIGTFIDYQAPLKNKRSDSAGKIDLLSYNRAHNAFYIVELKREDSNEPLLRAILEAYTYVKQVDIEKLRRDFYDLVTNKLESNDRPREGDDVLSAPVRPAVLIYDNSNQRKEVEKGGPVICLADRLEVGIYYLSVLDNANTFTGTKLCITTRHMPSRHP